jgi:hypothetical protein
LLPTGIFILLLLIPQFSHGDSTAAMAATAENALVEARLRMIEERLEAAVPSVRYWQYGWTGFYAASATL